MIDWHSHVLPAMDDGSRDVNESLAMLSALHEQGVSCVAATPHFYANDESVTHFLDRRQNSYNHLHQNLHAGLPQVFCGAEVKYYPGISRLAGLEQLKIHSTDLLLLEMPMTRWTEYIVKELAELASTRNLTLVLAHVERYAALQPRHTMEYLHQNGILMQVNASFFNRLASRRKALNLLRMGRIHFLGSDCHNMTTRAPQIGKAFTLIERKLGAEHPFDINAYSRVR